MSKRCEFDKLWASGETERIQEFQSCGEIESTHEFKFLKKQSEDVSKVTINSPRVTGLITGSANLDMVVYDTWYLWRSGKYLGMR